MKYMLAFFFVLFLLPLTMVNAAQAPFPTWLDHSADYEDPQGAHPFAPESSDSRGVTNQKVLRFIYEISEHGGGTGSHGLGVYLPAGAVIERSFYKVITQFVDSGSGTVALSCEDANNIKTAGDFTGDSANAFVEGASTGAASAFVRGIAAKCEVTATVATAAQTAGKLVGWIKYVVEN